VIHESRPHVHFKPYNVGRWIVWGLFALVLWVAPMLWKSGLGLTMLSQIGIAVIACLAYTCCWGRAAC
jgi:branched-chain amino acid transport system permease protein